MGAWRFSYETGIMTCSKCGYSEFIGPIPDREPTHDCKEIDFETCINRGSVAGYEECKPCSEKSGMTVRIKVFECSVHGHCTIDPIFSGIRSCKPCCKDFKYNDKTVETNYNELPISKQEQVMKQLESQ